MSPVRVPARLALILAPALFLLATPRDASASFLSVSVASPALVPGQSTEVGIVLNATESFTLRSASFAFTFDASRFALTSFDNGSLITDGFGTYYPGANFGAATITLNGAGVAIGAGQAGTISRFTLTALASAPAGPSVLDLKASFAFDLGQDIRTQVNGGAIALVPPPTDGFDPGVDAVVTIAPTAAVPEPSSLALCGIAAMAGVALAHARARGRRA